jgi:hypothetical protein
MSESESEYDDFNTDESPAASPPLLIRSFLTIASSSVACLLIYAILGMGLAAVLFPDVSNAMLGENVKTDPDFAIPIALVVPWILLHVICCVGIGWVTARVAPFAPDKHGLILAIFLFICWTQKVFESGPNRFGMNVAFTVAIPLAIAYGSRMYTDRQLETDATSDRASEEVT